MKKIRDFYNKIDEIKKDQILLFILGIVIGIAGYFIYYKEQLELINTSVMFPSCEMLNNIVVGGIGGVVVSLIAAILAGFVGKGYNLRNASFLFLGGLFVNIIMMLLDLVF